MDTPNDRPTLDLMTDQRLTRLRHDMDRLMARVRTLERWMIGGLGGSVVITLFLAALAVWRLFQR